MTETKIHDIVCPKCPEGKNKFNVKVSMENDSKRKSSIIYVHCPNCNSTIEVDTRKKRYKSIAR
jgi:hypothetical protein